MENTIHDNELVPDVLNNYEELQSSPNMQSNHSNGRGLNKQSKDLSNVDRWKVYYALLGKAVNGKLRKTSTLEVANMLSIPVQTVRRIWAIHKSTPEGENVDVSHKKSNCGRKRIQIDSARVLEVPLRQRTTLRSLSTAVGIHPSVLHRQLKRGEIRRHTNPIKPLLRDDNKKARLQFFLSMVDQSNPNESKFIDMYNYIHIDEKWFYMSKKKETYYLLPIEDDPLRTCQSKNFIQKVMFLVAIARPRYDSNGVETFSGKIGLFPFVTFQRAQRRSRNRDVGTLEMKPITSVTRETVKAFLIEKVIPSIREKWPTSGNGEVIFIRQDNARTHVLPNDEDFKLAAAQSGLDIRLICQPPNSPDMNILDLGFFNAIQSLQHHACPQTVQQLVDAVIEAFNDYPSRSVNHVWLTLQLCMLETMKHGGSNEYQIPHISKSHLEKEGRLPAQISCDPKIIVNALDMLG